MKKALLLVSVLFISVMTTACINNLAVQELNNKAQVFMEQGDYQNAIERLKSSIDLDPSIFESHYNLAVAYTKAEDYSNAIKVYNDAIKLNPDYADTYYSLAVCEENLATDLFHSIVTLDEAGNIVKVDPTQDESEELAQNKDKLSEANYNYMLELLKSAVGHYQQYLEKSTKQDDSDDVKAKIEDLNSRIDEFSQKSGVE